MIKVTEQGQTVTKLRRGQDLRPVDAFTNWFLIPRFQYLLSSCLSASVRQLQIHEQCTLMCFYLHISSCLSASDSLWLEWLGSQATELAQYTPAITGGYRDTSGIEDA